MHEGTDEATGEPEELHAADDAPTEPVEPTTEPADESDQAPDARPDGPEPANHDGHDDEGDDGDHDAPAPFEPTGHDGVDGAMASLDGLEDRSVHEHVAVFEEAHAALRHALDHADPASPPGPASQD